MNAQEVEKELAHLDDPDVSGLVGTGISLSIAEALEYRDAGNLPDPFGRSLRLVLRTDDPDPEAIARRRLDFEPDFHEAPTWRRAGSKPVNVIPVRARAPKVSLDAWWNDPVMERLEAEWAERGTIGGIAVPGEYRSFVLKTVAALQASGKPVTPTAVADSIARWVSPQDAEEIRSALLRANPQE